MRKYRKEIIFWGICLAITLMVILLTKSFGYSTYTGLFISFISAAFIFFGNKFSIFMNAKNKVKKLINEETSDRFLSDIYELLGRLKFFHYPIGTGRRLKKEFKELLSFLKHSQLKKQGDPKYVLPWFLVLGPIASGKTAAISNSKIMAPFLERQLFRCGKSNFWLHNNGVVIDTPGSFVSYGDRSEHGEWIALCRLLKHYHRKDPLNGIVVVVSTDYLLNSDQQILEDDAKRLRIRLNEVMEILNISIPIYLIISKCDLIEGFPEWTSVLPDSYLNQAMGFARNEDKSESKDFIHLAMTIILDQLKDLLLPAMNKPDIAHKVLRLPSNVERLIPPVKYWTDGIFQDSSYHKVPSFVGVYLIGIISKIGSEDSNGLFINRLFTEILPANRHIHSKSTGFPFRRISDILIAGVTGVISLGILSVIWLSYTSNVNFIKHIANHYQSIIVERQSFEENIVALEKLREMIVATHYEVSQLWVPWFGFSDTPSFVRQMQTMFVDRFRRNILYELENFFDAGVSNEIETIRSSGATGRTSRYIIAIKTRIKIIEEHLNGTTYKDLIELPPPFADLPLFFKNEISYDLLRSINLLYLQSLEWSYDTDIVRAELTTMQNSLLTITNPNALSIGKTAQKTTLEQTMTTVLSTVQSTAATTINVQKSDRIGSPVESTIQAKSRSTVKSSLISTTSVLPNQETTYTYVQQPLNRSNPEQNVSSTRPDDEQYASHKRVYIVNVATLLTISSAKNKAYELKQKGYFPKIYWATDSNSVKQYIISIGPYDQKEKAGNAAALFRLREKFKPDIKAIDPATLSEHLVE